jgi:hypothetical protein
MDLIEWTTHYIDYANSFKKDLISKNIHGKSILCEYKIKGKVSYLIREELNEGILKELSETNTVIVTLNKKDNAKYMIEKWQEFIKNKSLKVMFSNPELNLQWTVVPYLHNNFTDPAALKTGIKSLFESIPEV